MKRLIIAACIIVAFVLLFRQEGQAQTGASQYVYLPLVARGVETAYLVTPTATATATRTSTPTATSTPVCDGVLQVLQNPSFETGLDPWWLGGLPLRTSTFATDGYWSLLLGGYNNASDYIAQHGPVPAWAETAAVYFDAIMFSNDSTFYIDDALVASVMEIPSGVKLAEGWIWNNTERARWIRWKLPVNNITLWRGHEIGVMLHGMTGDSYVTGWYVDQARLYFGCGTWPAGMEDAVDITPTN